MQYPAIIATQIFISYKMPLKFYPQDMLWYEGKLYNRATLDKMGVLAEALRNTYGPSAESLPSSPCYAYIPEEITLVAEVIQLDPLA